MNWRNEMGGRNAKKEDPLGPLPLSEARYVR